MTKLGRVLGIVGFVSLLSVPLTLFLWDWEFTWVAAAKAVFGVTAVVFWLVTNLGGIRQRFQGRSVFYWGFAALFVLVGVAVVVIANYVAQVYPKQLDLTEEKIFSLSEQSTEVLGELKGEVKVTAFYGSKEPGYEPVRSVLDLYRYASDRFVYEFVDPVVRDDLVEKYKIVVGGPRLILSYQGQEERVKLESEDQSGPEEAITAALLKLTATGERRKVCFTTGHGERALKGEDPQQVASLMVQDLQSEGYQSDSLSLLEQPQVPPACQVVVLLGPRQDFIAGEIDSLRKYLEGGGRLLAFLGPGDTASLNGLLLSYGVLLGPDTVVNPKSRSALEVVSDPMRYPQTHPIFSRFFRGGMVVLNQLQAVFPVARAVRKASGDKFNVTEMAFSTPQAWSETDNLEAAETVAYDEGKDLAGPVSLAVVAEGKPAPPPAPPTQSTPESAPVGARLAVFGSSLFPVDAAYRIFPFNRNLTMNTLAWLAAEEKKITIRPRFRAASLLRLDESQMKFITFFSQDILPLLILAFGISVWQIRRWS